LLHVDLVALNDQAWEERSRAMLIIGCDFRALSSDCDAGTGELTSDLLALDARTGKVLLRSAMDGPSAGSVVTYDARGERNVAIVSGFVRVFNSSLPISAARTLRSQSSASGKMRETDCIATKNCPGERTIPEFQSKAGFDVRAK
jgi:hypothetical protein